VGKGLITGATGALVPMLASGLWDPAVFAGRWEDIAKKFGQSVAVGAINGAFEGAGDFMMAPHAAAYDAKNKVQGAGRRRGGAGEIAATEAFANVIEARAEALKMRELANNPPPPATDPASMAPDDTTSGAKPKDLEPAERRGVAGDEERRARRRTCRRRTADEGPKSMRPEELAELMPAAVADSDEGPKSMRPEELAAQKAAAEKRTGDAARRGTPKEMAAAKPDVEAAPETVRDGDRRRRWRPRSRTSSRRPRRCGDGTPKDLDAAHTDNGPETLRDGTPRKWRRRSPTPTTGRRRSGTARRRTWLPRRMTTDPRRCATARP
jgi:hypothetical protein